MKILFDTYLPYRKGDERNVKLLKDKIQMVKNELFTNGNIGFAFKCIYKDRYELYLFSDREYLILFNSISIGNEDIMKRLIYIITKNNITEIDNIGVLAYSTEILLQLYGDVRDSTKQYNFDQELIDMVLFPYDKIISVLSDTDIRSHISTGILLNEKVNMTLLYDSNINTTTELSAIVQGHILREKLKKYTKLYICIKENKKSCGIYIFNDLSRLYESGLYESFESFDNCNIFELTGNIYFSLQRSSQKFITSPLPFVLTYDKIVELSKKYFYKNSEYWCDMNMGINMNICNNRNDNKSEHDTLVLNPGYILADFADCNNFDEGRLLATRTKVNIFDKYPIVFVVRCALRTLREIHEEIYVFPEYNDALCFKNINGADPFVKTMYCVTNKNFCIMLNNREKGYSRSTEDCSAKKYKNSEIYSTFVQSCMVNKTKIYFCNDYINAIKIQYEKKLILENSKKTYSKSVKLKEGSLRLLCESNNSLEIKENREKYRKTYDEHLNNNTDKNIDI